MSLAFVGRLCYILLRVKETIRSFRFLCIYIPFSKSHILAKPPKGGDAKPDGSNASPNGEYAMTAGCTLTDVFVCHCSVRLCWNGAFFVRGWLTIRRTFRAFCTEQGKTSLLAQWDIEQNLPLTPDAVTHGRRWSTPAARAQAAPTARGARLRLNRAAW